MPKSSRGPKDSKAKGLKALAPKPKATDKVKGGMTKHPAKVTIPDLKVAASYN